MVNTFNSSSTHTMAFIVYQYNDSKLSWKDFPHHIDIGDLPKQATKQKKMWREKQEKHVVSHGIEAAVS